MPPRPKVAAPNPARTGRSGPPARRFTTPRILVIVVVLITIEVVIWTVMWRRTHPSVAVIGSPDMLDSPAATKLPYPQLLALAASVKGLQDQRRYAEALPGARRLLEQHDLHGRLVSSMLVDYARMLNNAAFEAGAGAPRSSFERIALEQQALQQTQRALAMARTPRERAEAITFVGLVHEAWGFPYDAYATYRGAVGVDPTYPVALEHFKAYGGRVIAQRVPR